VLRTTESKIHSLDVETIASFASMVLAIIVGNEDVFSWEHHITTIRQVLELDHCMRKRPVSIVRCAWLHGPGKNARTRR
jgi:hypothetical protein